MEKEGLCVSQAPLNTIAYTKPSTSCLNKVNQLLSSNSKPKKDDLLQIPPKDQFPDCGNIDNINHDKYVHSTILSETATVTSWKKKKTKLK